MFLVSTPIPNTYIPPNCYGMPAISGGGGDQVGDGIGARKGRNERGRGREVTAGMYYVRED